MEWLGLSIFAWITVAVMIGKFAMSVRSRLPGDIISFLAIAVLLVTGALSTEQALDCFSDESVWVVILLLVLVAGLVLSGVIDWMVLYLMGNTKNYTQALNRIIIPVACLSAIMNNETVVAVFMKVVNVWCKKLNLPPSKFLLPMSYAAGFGGVCTLIGSAPNLLVAYMYQNQTGERLNIFAPFFPGVCCAIVGILTLNLMKKYIPSRKSPAETFEDSKNYTVELMVPSECPCVGQTVEEAGLYNVEGGHLIEILNFDQEVVSPVPKDTYVLGGDRLVYTGSIKEILKLKKKKGLVNATHHVFSVKEMDDKQRNFQMVSILSNSDLIGNSMENSDFEEQNQVVLVAVARDGERLTQLPRKVELRSRDILLFEGARMNPDNFRYSLLFLDNTPLPVKSQQTFTATFIMLGMILLSTFNVLSLLKSAILAVVLMALLRCLTIKQIQQNINWPLLCSFAGSVCLSSAITETGLAHFFANWVLHLSGSNPLMALSVICFITTFLTEFISNTGAAAVFAPIGFKIATALNVNPLTFMIGIMICASNSFATPGSCSTHEMISGPGGYKFTDFMKLGIPMNFIMLFAAIAATVFFFPLR